MRRAQLLLAIALFAGDARAGWPDVGARIERGLGSEDVLLRRGAADRLRELGRANAEPLVLRALEDPDVDVRVAAARAAIELRIDKSAELVQAWLSDREQKLRQRACDVLGAFPSKRAIAPLARALGDPDASVRGAAASGLGAQSSAEAVSPLIGKLEDPEPTVRIRVAQALARLRDTRAIVPLVGKAQDSAAEVRLAIVRALGAIGDSRATQALLLSLRDANQEVRTAGIEALGNLRDRSAVDALVPFLAERNASVRRAATEAIGAIGGDAAIQPLIGALGAFEDGSALEGPSATRLALVAMGTRAVDPLLGVLVSGGKGPASSAAWILGELREKRAIPPLVHGLRTGALPPGVALHALGRIHEPSVLPAILESLRIPEGRMAALRATDDLLDPGAPDGRAVDPLADLLARGEMPRDERVLAIRLLGKTGSPRAITPLAIAFAKEGTEDRREAVKSLARLSLRGDEPLPVKGLEHDLLLALSRATTAEERMDTALAIGAIGSSESRREILSALRDEASSDRIATIEALSRLFERAAPPDDLAKGMALFREAGPKERDALLVALGRAKGFAEDFELDGGPDERRVLASVLAAQGDAGLGKLRALLRDPDATVRAEAAWFLGETGGSVDLPLLVEAAKDKEAIAAIDAIASLARLARAKGVKSAASHTALCHALGAVHPFARANALVGLGFVGRCGDGQTERRLAETDKSALVRQRAAELIRLSPNEEDRAALARCRATEAVGAVADACVESVKSTATTQATVRVSTYVLPPGHAEPEARTPYAVEFADGVIKVGRTDRRGAFFEPLAPAGPMTLRTTIGD